MVGWGTTGGIFSIRLCRPVMGKAGANRLLSQALTGGRPQMNTNTERMIQGVQAAISALLLCLATGWGGLTSEALTSLPRSEAEVQIFLGCQTRRNRIRLAMETMAAMMSTSSGPMKLETRYWGMAQISQNGTSTEKKGNWWPIMAVTSVRS